MWRHFEGDSKPNESPGNHIVCNREHFRSMMHEIGANRETNKVKWRAGRQDNASAIVGIQWLNWPRSRHCLIDCLCVFNQRSEIIIFSGRTLKMTSIKHSQISHAFFQHLFIGNRNYVHCMLWIHFKLRHSPPRLEFIQQKCVLYSSLHIAGYRFSHSPWNRHDAVECNAANQLNIFGI